MNAHVDAGRCRIDEDETPNFRWELGSQGSWVYRQWRLVRVKEVGMGNHLVWFVAKANDHEANTLKSNCSKALWTEKEIVAVILRLSLHLKWILSSDFGSDLKGEYSG